MGRLVQKVIIQKVAELTSEDIQKQTTRRKRRFDSWRSPQLLPWQKRFAERLMKCPYCGKAPHLNCIWSPTDGFDYKFSCGFGKEHHRDMGCGDWYTSLSRAGLSWNYRVLEAKGGPHRIVRHHKSQLRPDVDPDRA